MFSFQKLTYDQYKKLLNDKGTIRDSIFVVMDKGKIFIHSSNGAVNSLNINIKTVDEFPSDENAQENCIYYNSKTKEQKIWAKNGWMTVNLDDLEQKIKTLSSSPFNKLEEEFKQKNIQFNIPLNTPLIYNKSVRTLDDLKEVKVSDIQSKNLILVQTKGLYVYDAKSMKEQDKQKNVLKPNEITTTPGRWIKLFRDNFNINQNRDINLYKIKLEQNQQQSKKILDQQIEKGMSILKESIEKEKDITEKAVKWFIDKNTLFNSSDDSSFSSNFDYDGIM